MTPHAHARAGVMQSGLVSIYICVYMYMTKKVLNGTLAVGSPFQTRSTSHQIYRLALPLYAPEMLYSLSKSRISLFNVHLALFVRRMTQSRSHNPIGKYRHLVN